MTTNHITISAKAHNGKVIVNAEIPVTDDAENYLITIDVAPEKTQPNTLDDLYGALADCPLPEINDDQTPEHRDDLEV